jgi:predicted GNAT family acetyltransferase
VHDAAASRYELVVDGRRLGHLDYRRDGDVVDLFHTEVEPEEQGAGLGSELVAGALDDVRAGGGHIRPSCPFVAAFLAEHDEYGDLVV